MIQPTYIKKFNGFVLIGLIGIASVVALNQTMNSEISSRKLMDHCPKGKRVCIFIHGAREDKDESTQTSHSSYWGSKVIEDEHTPCCSSRFFLRIKSTRSWTDEENQQKVCNESLKLCGTPGSKTINDCVFITHSMGALVLSGALSNGFCSFGNNVGFASSQAPMEGAKIAEFFAGGCHRSLKIGERLKKIRKKAKKVVNKGGKTLKKGIERGKKIGGKILKRGKEIAGKVKDKIRQWTICKLLKPYIYSLSPSRLKDNNDGWATKYKKAQEVYQTHVTASLCGTSTVGIFKKESVVAIALKWLSFFANFLDGSVVTDGLVELSSCKGLIDDKNWGTSPDHLFYIAKINHFDGNFDRSDDKEDKEKQPLEWINNAIKWG